MVSELRVLAWHCEYFRYRPTKKALKDVPDENVGEWVRLDNVLVALITIESEDDEFVAECAIEEITRMRNEVGADRVLLYPYAHLSPDLAQPRLAMRLLEKMYRRLRSYNVEAHLAPFGYYKEFEAHVKGHPLAERFRSISREETAREYRAGLRKSYIIITPSGEEVSPSEDALKKFGKDFGALVRKEALGVALPEMKHEMIRYLRRFGFEWEARSDHGHQRLSPYAALIFDLVAEYARSVCRRVNVPIYEVRGTAFFNMGDRAVREHAELYGDRLYKIRTDKGVFVLRYAACHQQFSMLADWSISYKNMPFGVFEIADSYRYEQSGEVELSFRLRRFWMPDLHVIVADEDEAWEMLFRIHNIIMDEACKLGQTYELLVNVASPEHYDRCKNRIVKLAKSLGRPILVAIYSPGLPYYWTINIEYHIIDYLGRPREIGTVQIDVGNAERFGITYVDADGSRKHPVIIHTAIIGTIERYIYMLFDSAMKRMRAGKKPMLPFWASPIQVRVIPVDESAMGYSREIVNSLSSLRVRVDIDDTNRTLSRKILDAEKEWVPYVVIVGKKEVEARNVTVRIRSSGEQRTMRLEELVEILKKEQDGYPWRDITIPRELSRRIHIVV